MLNHGYSKIIGRDRQNAKAETDRRGTVEEIRIDRHGCGAGRRKERIENLNSGKELLPKLLILSESLPHQIAPGGDGRLRSGPAEKAETDIWELDHNVYR